MSLIQFLFKFFFLLFTYVCSQHVTCEARHKKHHSNIEACRNFVWKQSKKSVEIICEFGARRRVTLIRTFFCSHFQSFYKTRTKPTGRLVKDFKSISHILISLNNFLHLNRNRSVIYAKNSTTHQYHFFFFIHSCWLRQFTSNLFVSLGRW